MTKLTRRTVLAGLSSLAAMRARAETAWPNRPMTIVHGFPGGATDLIARVVAEGLSKRLGTQAIVEVRPGAAGTLVAGQTARAAPDGYTLLAIPSGHAVAAATYKKLPYRTVEDFSMISMTAEYPFALVTHAEHPIRAMADLVAIARTRSTPLLYGTPGNGSLPHLSVELLAKMTDLQFQHVPYRGPGQSVSDLLGKRIDFVLDPPTAYLELIKQGQLRAVAVSGSSRYFALPGVPTIAEAAVPKFVVTSWQGLVAPAGVPAPIVARLNAAVAEVLSEPAAIERLKAQGNDPRPSSPDEFKTRMEADIEKWTAVVANANIERI
jgi:tripartite-type tricarboxylate transporter receptor subunit TctC